MKKLVLSISMSLLFIAVGFAQKSNRTSAFMYKQKGQLVEAKEAIDKAVQNEKTKNDPKTWLYYGEIYYAIATSPLPQFQKLDSTAAIKAFHALQKAKKLDEQNKKHKIAKEADEYIKKLSNVFYAKGAEVFKKEDYHKAIEYFEYAYKVSQELGKFDTTAAYNIGITGVLGKEPKVAAEYLKKCVDVNFHDPKIFIYYNRALQQLGDTAGAEAAIKEGRKRFPQNLSLLLEQAQLYLERGDANKLIASLKKAIEKKPDNPSNANFNFLIGKSYDDMGKQDSAEIYYKKAIQVNPKFFEAYYNIGAIYVNKAAKIQKEANDLPLSENKKFEALEKEANANLKKAIPWLEKALALNPNDGPTIKGLKEAYARLKMNDKLKELMSKQKK
ncbi:tetratricopeptide repeat protein [Candidatus Sulfidibacterium hydrothermale]|uniref:tetratricopeptide repeat protein n=1 Tax=Candidatus Sulfidibacterium hydrothermale TaxID=2875962 RepID=UPI001F0B3D3C|nr:tetratricopeptide repeat protein [Candidatus Sulfidibacterium hydrothermale]UBM61410.1 tetratricopeptide repeat protein [Candidatus Sulfidibacterium hydrothermale]